MSEDYLAKQREKSLGDDSYVSEAELHATHENISDIWQALQDCKRRIALKKREASLAVDSEFKEELDGLMADYAMALTLTR